MKHRKDNNLLKEAMIKQKALERRNNIIPNKPKRNKLNLRGLI